MVTASVILPFFNGKAFLRDALQSLADLDRPDAEFICVDDGSTDGSAELVESFRRRDARFVLVSQENQGLAGARNTGLAAATGEYVHFLDADDRLAPDALARIHDRIAEHDADVCLFGFANWFADDDRADFARGALQTDLAPAEVFSGADLADGLFRITTPAVWKQAYRRAFLDSRSLRFHADLRRAEDVPLTYTCLAVAPRITVLDEPLYLYRRDNATSLQNTIHRRPTAIVTALLHLRDDLGHHHVLERHGRAFADFVAEQIWYSLGIIGTRVGFMELVSAFLTARETLVAGFPAPDPRMAPWLAERYETLMAATSANDLLPHFRAHNPALNGPAT